MLLRRINYRITLIAIIIIAQIVWGILFFLRILDYSEWISTGLSTFSLLVVLFLNMKEENASYKIGWIILIMALPVFGGLFYLVFGNKRPSRFMRSRLLKEHQKVLPLLKQDIDVADRMGSVNYRALGTSQYVYAESDYPLYGNTQTKYYPVGEKMFEDMLKEMEKARRYIFFEYFIVEEGIMWDRMLQTLVKKVQEGVDVRMIYDDVGSMFLLPGDFAKKIESQGIKCMAFNRFRPILSVVLNHRDHRKILVIDGHTAFTGGINLADEYINQRDRFGHWKDTGIMLKGDGVWSFVVMFLEMWNAFRDDTGDPDDFRPLEGELEGRGADGFVQPFSDSPLDNEPLGENIYIEVLAQARNYVYIFTPYLIIDNELQSGLCLAAKRGVDVRIVTPGIPDKKLVFRITRSNYLPLLRAGVRIYEYTPGFMHAKSYVCDDRIGVVGTVNMDYRSLYLHFECGAILYGNKSIMELKEDSLETIEKSMEIRIGDMNQSFFARVFDAVLRVFAILF
ncbi:MAG: cardiolipin synthase [Bacillota bacterium]